VSINGEFVVSLLNAGYTEINLAPGAYKIVAIGKFKEAYETTVNVAPDRDYYLEFALLTSNKPGIAVAGGLAVPTSDTKINSIQWVLHDSSSPPSALESCRRLNPAVSSVRAGP
jgi:hypothetical protein